MKNLVRYLLLTLPPLSPSSIQSLMLLPTHLPQPFIYSSMHTVLLPTHLSTYPLSSFLTPSIHLPILTSVHLSIRLSVHSLSH